MKKIYLLFLATSCAAQAMEKEASQPSFDPQAYSESNIGQFKHAIKELHKLNLSGAEILLDIGSGDGKTSKYIATEYLPNGKVHGIDSSPEMVKFASLNERTLNAYFICADACEFESVHQQYDVITSFWTLHWIPEYEKALENVARLLKPGGKALLCHAVGADPIEEYIAPLLATEKWKPYKDHYRPLPLPSLTRVADAIEKSGLKIGHLEVKKNTEWMSAGMSQQNFLSLPLLNFIPKESREAFCREGLQLYLAKYPLNEKGEIYQELQVVVMVLEKKKEE